MVKILDNGNVQYPCGCITDREVPVRITVCDLCAQNDYSDFTRISKQIDEIHGMFNSIIGAMVEAQKNPMLKMFIGKLNLPSGE